MYYVYLVAPYDDTSMYIVSNNEGIQDIQGIKGIMYTWWHHMLTDLYILYLIMRVYRV